MARSDSKIVAQEVSRKNQLKKEISSGKKTITKLSKRLSRAGSGASKAASGTRRAIKYKRNLPSNLQRTFGGAFGGATTQGTNKRVKEGPGRPRGDFKHRSPFNGQPIPATEYYKQIRDFKRLQLQRANKVDQTQVQQLAKRGIPPQQAKEIVDTRQLRQVVAQQPQQFQQQPQQINPNLPPELQRQIFIQQLQNQRRNVFASQVPRNIPRYGRRGQFIEGDAFGNPKVKTFGDETSFWN